MRNVFVVFLAVALNLNAAGCTAEPSRPAFQTERTPDGLMFIGSITPQAFVTLEEQLREGDLLLITSPGGERRSAERLADLIDRRDVSVRVGGECASACALYLALGAPRVVVPEAAIVLLHSDTEMWVRALENKPQSFSEADRAEIERADDASRRILQRRGVDPEILSCIASAIRPRYDEMRRTLPLPAEMMSTHEVRFAIPSDFDFVWLSPEVLNHFGAQHMDTQWSVNEGGRASYANLTGKRIAWVDSLEQCQ